MMRFVISLVALTVVSLFVVAGEVEALKSGYKIRRLNMTRLEYRENIQKLGSQIARLKTPGVLEERMLAYRVTLTEPKVFSVAKMAKDSNTPQSTWNSSIASNPLTRLFLGTAQADNP